MRRKIKHFLFHAGESGDYAKPRLIIARDIPYIIYGIAICGRVGDDHIRRFLFLSFLFFIFLNLYPLLTPIICLEINSVYPIYNPKYLSFQSNASL